MTEGIYTFPARPTIDENDVDWQQILEVVEDFADQITALDNA